MLRKASIYFLCIAVAGLTVGCSSMSPEREKACLIGAGLGALAGGGIAAGAIAGGHGHSRSYEIGVPLAALGGAVAGGLIGCMSVTETPPPPPPPPPPPVGTHAAVVHATSAAIAKTAKRPPMDIASASCRFGLEPRAP